MSSKKKRKKENSSFTGIIIIIITLISGFYLSEVDSTFGLENTDDLNNKEIEVIKEVSSDLKISILNVGQADSILISNNGEEMLIDTGNNEDGKLLVKYFKEIGINNFKYVVGTHPHEDHIGGLDDIINNFQIETIYLPDAITTTKTFMDVLDAIEEKDMNFTVPVIGEVFKLGEALIQVIYTGTDTSDLNNTSIVLRLDFGNTSFLFMGDATKKTESIILNSNLNCKADVLKIGHHGSNYGTTDSFLDAVNPKIAVISVGNNNTYKHPHSNILNKLKKKDIDIYRTDLDGTIIISSNGKDIIMDTSDINLNGG